MPGARPGLFEDIRVDRVYIGLDYRGPFLDPEMLNDRRIILCVVRMPTK